MNPYELRPGDIVVSEYTGKCQYRVTGITDQGYPDLESMETPASSYPNVSPTKLHLYACTRDEIRLEDADLPMLRRAMRD